MNQFFYEQTGKEKIRNLRDEGIRSQAFYRSGAPRFSRVLTVPRLSVTLLSVLGILALLLR